MWLRRTFTTSLLAIRIVKPLASRPLSVCCLLSAYVNVYAGSDQGHAWLT